MLKAKTAGQAGKKKKHGTKEAQLESLELAHTIVKPKIPGMGSASSSFRAVRYAPSPPPPLSQTRRCQVLIPKRFHPKEFETVYAVLNTVDTKGKRQRRSYIVKNQWIANQRAWRVVNTRKINEGSITCFDIR